MAKPGTTTLDHLNRVHLYLGATGKMILSCTLTGYAQFRPVTPWPNQTKPTKYSWQIWQQYLHQFFSAKILSNS
eukprot:5131225-Ditylum_brightwellii.AAC.2